MKLHGFLYFLVVSFQLVHSIPHNFTSLFSFGDSLADTGNFLRTGAVTFPSISRLPYGMTYFRRATGRCSDGRLVVDFMADALGLPFLPPYLGRRQNFRRGVNFAVAGATAMDPLALREMGVHRFLWTNDSLSRQLKWFDQLKPSLCKSSQECSSYFDRSLFVVGEIGGNDYNYAFFSGMTAAEVTSFVPRVVRPSRQQSRTRAVHLLVPGNLPVGCSAAYLTLLPSQNSKDYDPRNGCLKKLNVFARYHNALLLSALQHLRSAYPRVRITYADYYGAVIRFAHSPHHYGFAHGALRSCCGGGGPYNFNWTARCGHPGARACVDPSKYVNWDGIHLTEAAYRLIADTILRDLQATHS
ncbi:hypothetical protein HPP92_021382 [Vanilla planifolia]|uniref:Uncharacterized protein n=1 Tax=Vanilla planifolia TaxID=51239 RepID=A0A835Q1R8_VANPL|nr:hypothetical protein HPP92_021759 [Vanilla planifolia]KAG0462906.1 hypothetical protein HPP92_021382 [Vanilla planifolia]